MRAPVQLHAVVTEVEHVPARKVGKRQFQRAARRNVRIQRPYGVQIFRQRSQNGGLRGPVGLGFCPVGLPLRTISLLSGLILTGCSLRRRCLRPVPRLEQLVRQFFRRSAVRHVQPDAAFQFRTVLLYHLHLTIQLPLQGFRIDFRRVRQVEFLRFRNIAHQSQRCPFRNPSGKEPHHAAGRVGKNFNAVITRQDKGAFLSSGSRPQHPYIPGLIQRKGNAVLKHSG